MEGNEHVILARFADADFFVKEDIKRPLAEYLPRLGTMVFQVDLGSMLEKAHRIQKLVEDLFLQIQVSELQRETTRRAAELCKADLATKMVVEMTSLQGQMGRYYAQKSDETLEVAQAIFDHYLPRFSGDQTAQSLPGLIVGIADRLDTIVGLFAAGLAPSGNKDPFAQRRSALGLVQNLLSWNLDMDLREAVACTAAHLPVRLSQESELAAIDFIVERLRNLLLEQGQRFDVIDAVLSVQGANPAGAARAVSTLMEWSSREEWNRILPAYARCVRITRDLDETYLVHPELLREPEERDLFHALIAAEETQFAPRSIDGFLKAFEPMIPYIDCFFQAVLVMIEDPQIRNNRLGLLQRIVTLAKGAADFSHLEGF